MFCVNGLCFLCVKLYLFCLFSSERYNFFVFCIFTTFFFQFAIILCLFYSISFKKRQSNVATYRAFIRALSSLALGLFTFLSRRLLVLVLRPILPGSSLLLRRGSRSQGPRPVQATMGSWLSGFLLQD